MMLVHFFAGIEYQSSLRGTYIQFQMKEALRHLLDLNVLLMIIRRSFIILLKITTAIINLAKLLRAMLLRTFGVFIELIVHWNQT